jgi:hypothetical protein
MDRTERFYKIDKMLAERKRVTFSELLESLSVSAATLKRDLEYMRNRLNAPIIWDRDDPCSTCSPALTLAACLVPMYSPSCRVSMR